MTEHDRSTFSSRADEREDVRATIHHLKDQGRSLIEERQHRVAESIGNVGRALHAGRDSLSNDDAMIADAFDQLGRQCDQLARYVGRNRPERLLHDVANGVRRRPELFLGGLFFGGLAMARLLKNAQYEDELTSRGDAEPSTDRDFMDRSMERAGVGEAERGLSDEDLPGYARPTSYGDNSFDPRRERSNSAFSSRQDVQRDNVLGGERKGPTQGNRNFSNPGGKVSSY